MNLKAALGLPLFAAAILSAGLLAGCGGNAQPAEEDYTRVLNIEVEEVVPEPFTAMIRVAASIEAFHDVTIVAEEGGVVDRILVPRGARVQKGQTLARLDSEVLQAQLEEARAAADLVQDQWQRQKRLWEEEQIGTELAYIQARENARMRAATVRTLETRLRKATIRSPVSGTFEDYFVEEGEYATPGAPFARVISTQRMKLTGGVPERFSTEITVGTPVEIMLAPYSDRRFHGTISFVGNALDTQSRTIPVEVYLDNPGGIMKAGMIANLSIVRMQLEDALVVPQEAVLRNEGGYHVFVAEREDSLIVARSRQVQLGPSQEDRVVITSGLKPGDRVVTVGQLKLGNGDVLNVVKKNGGPGGSGEGNDSENDGEGGSV